MSLTSTKPVELPPSPYKGLMPYTEADAAFFFGRDTERENITANLMASRLTLLYGPSGVGKSSVLMAGVANQLLVEARRKLDAFDSPGYAVIVFNDWKDAPLESLNQQIEKVVGELFEEYNIEPVSPSSMLADNLKEWTERTGGKLLIILDQFEEYFLYHSEESEKGTFGYEFPVAVNRVDLKVNFLISIREDALAKLDKFKGKIPGLFDNYLRIDYLTQVGAKAAIEKPIEEYNQLLSSEEEAYTIEPELVEIVLEELKSGKIQLGGNGSNKLTEIVKTETRIETPYLQLVMIKLWEVEKRIGLRQLRLSTLRELGGAEEIVSTHLDTSLNSLLDDEREIAARIFRHLVTPSGAKIAHTLADLTDYTKNPASKIALVLTKLASPEIRIVRASELLGGNSSNTRYEIYHDVLAKAILDWRNRYEKQKAVREAHQAHKTRLRRLWRFSVLFGVGFLLVLALAIFAIVSALDANNSKSISQAETNRAITSQAESNIQRMNADNAKATAIANQGEMEKQRQVAEDQKTEAQVMGLVAQSRLFQNKTPDLALLFGVEATLIKNTLTTQGSLIEAVNNTLLDTYLRGHTGVVLSVAFSPDGKTLASGSTDNTIILWDVVSKKQINQLKGNSSDVFSIAFSPDGKTLASGSTDKTIILWDVASGKQVSQLEGHTGVVYSVAFSPDGKTLASGSTDKTIILWDVASGKLLSKLENHATRANSVIFSPDGKTLASGNEDRTVILWDVTSGKQLNQLEGHSAFVTSVSFSPDGKTLASGSGDKTIILWDVVSRTQLSKFEGHSNSVDSVVFSPNGKILASGSRDSTIILWDVAAGKQINQIKGHSNEVYSLAFSPDGKTLASGSTDKTIILWDVTPRKQVTQLKDQNNGVNSVAFSPDGKIVASANDTSTIILWEVSSGKQINQFKGHTNTVNSVTFSPDGKTLASASWDSTIILWDVTAKKQINQLNGHISSVDSVVFSPNGKILASGSKDSTIILWEVSSGKQINQFKSSSYYSTLNSLAFSPNGKTLAFSIPDDTIILWDIDSGKQIAELKGHTYSVNNVIFSPDGKTLASASWDSTIILWDVTAKKQINQLKGHSTFVNSVAFSPDGKILASASDDSTIILWEISSGKQFAQLKGHTNKVNSVTFSPDGKTLASASDDSTIILWDLSLESLQSKACYSANRNLTQNEWFQFISDVPYQKTCPDLP